MYYFLTSEASITGMACESSSLFSADTTVHTRVGAGASLNGLVTIWSSLAGVSA